MQATVAIVDDEEGLREAVAEYLSGSGFRCLPAAGGAELRTLMAAEAVDVVVLDIAMPGESGLSVARSLRNGTKRLGIIFATASTASVDRIAGLEVGADDYIAKPYELRELLARVRSVLRRLPVGPAVPEPRSPHQRETIAVGRFSLDPASQLLSDETGRPVELTAMESELLAALATRPGRVLSRSQLLDLAHGRADEGTERSVDIRITRLRRKIEADPENPALIRTVRGEGYCFDPAR